MYPMGLRPRKWGSLRNGERRGDDNACEVKERAEEGNMGKNIEFIQKDRN